MTTMTLKVPELLRRGVEKEARRRGVSKSVLVRECVEAMLNRKRRESPPSCLDLVADLVGSQPGPRDASADSRYLDEAILADYGRKRKNSR
ncbi:MAG TPA: CopG family transcriptional regulator [Verrucomicrobiae bacterium]|nr:CopG family transcriptional regulator [Verrucomicrobiae bacterium]